MTHTPWPRSLSKAAFVPKASGFASTSIFTQQAEGAPSSHRSPTSEKVTIRRKTNGELQTL